MAAPCATFAPHTGRQRRAMFALCRELGIGGEERYDVIEGVTARRSSKGLSYGEMERVLSRLRILRIRAKKAEDRREKPGARSQESGHTRPETRDPRPAHRGLRPLEGKALRLADLLGWLEDRSADPVHGGRPRWTRFRAFVRSQTRRVLTVHQADGTVVELERDPGVEDPRQCTDVQLAKIVEALKSMCERQNVEGYRK